MRSFPAMAKIIRITVTPKGELTIETEGYKGSECKDATRDLEKMLGTVTSDTPTPEARQGTEAQHIKTR
jgi:hypothetical protein